MMFRKVVSIRNVGKFANYSARGDVEFRRLTMVYAENGCGKTTLAAILRSLQSGSAHWILERRTLNATAEPEVSFLLGTGMASFEQGVWSIALPDIEVFDDAFVHENVYAGDCISHEHRKNLYRVIVGEQGITLAEQVDKLDGQIRESNRQLADQKTALGALVSAGMGIDEFVALPPEEGIEAKLAAAQVDLAAFKRAGEIRGKPTLRPLTLPVLPQEFGSLLTRDLDGFSRTAEERVRRHMHACLGERGEAWIAQGLQYAGGDTCPFCGQAVAASELLAAYREYFGERYRALKQELTALHQRVSAAFGEHRLLSLQKTLGDNRSLCDFWQQFVAIEPPDLAFDLLQGAVEALRDCALASLERKLAAPLEAVQPGAAFESAATTYDAVRQAAEGYNRAVEVANELINRKKAETARTDSERIHHDLARLRAIEQRYTEQTDTLCRAYVRAGQEKKQREAAKRKAKRRLDEYTAGIFKTYQEEMNTLLAKFNTGFRIEKTTRSYLGGTPSSSYVLAIDDAMVELGDGKTPPGTPCFKNTLSAGDRSTLALAFFLARLHHDPRLAEKIVVLDDPITSQDLFRMTCTRQLICRLATQARQVIVLSHNLYFLKHLWENTVRRDAKALHITRDGRHSAIGEWDIELETRGEYFRNYASLIDYVENGRGDRRHVARCIRPLLEEYLRLKAPRDFRRTEWLGDFIEKIRQAPSDAPVAAAQKILPEIEDINEFSKKHHHRDSPGTESEPIADRELQAFVRRTLALVSRF